MSAFLRICRFGAVTALALTMFLGTAASTAQAQMPAPQASSSVLSRSTVSALQEALNKQGIAIPVDGVLGAGTRAAIRQFQTQHHLQVTGEPDKATLDKLGVDAGPSAAATPMARPRMGMARDSAPQRDTMQGGRKPGGMMQGGMMAHCETMHREMQSMMAMMQDMMKTMQAQMQMQPKQN